MVKRSGGAEINRFAPRTRSASATVTLPATTNRPRTTKPSSRKVQHKQHCQRRVHQMRCPSVTQVFHVRVHPSCRIFPNQTIQPAEVSTVAGTSSASGSVPCTMRYYGGWPDCPVSCCYYECCAYNPWNYFYLYKTTFSSKAIQNCSSHHYSNIFTASQNSFRLAKHQMKPFFLITFAP